MGRKFFGETHYSAMQVIDRILYKLDELVRPFVHKILVVIEPLLIDEDYYARVEGREIIANLSKVSSGHVPNLRILALEQQSSVHNHLLTQQRGPRLGHECGELADGTRGREREKLWREAQWERAAVSLRMMDWQK